MEQEQEISEQLGTNPTEVYADNSVGENIRVGNQPPNDAQLKQAQKALLTTISDRISIAMKNDMVGTAKELQSAIALIDQANAKIVIKAEPPPMPYL